MPFPRLTNNNNNQFQLSESVEKQKLAENSRVPLTADMASMSMTASLLPSTSSTLTRLPSTTARRGVTVAKASGAAEGEKGSMELKKESNNGRRELVFAAAAAAACSIANVAMGAEEPKAGTPEAKKKYAPICVTMPTARVCRK